jgi:integrase
MSAYTYDVRIWSTQTLTKKRGPVYKVRWAVDGKERTRSHQTRKLADSFRSKLITASREGDPFSPSTGLPVAMEPKPAGTTWYQHAIAYMDSLWPQASPRHRKGTAEALVTLTCAAVSSEVRGYVDSGQLRTALRQWSFNTTARHKESAPPIEHAEAVDWITVNSLPLATLADPSQMRRILAAIGLLLDGRPAAAATANRKRATLSGALRYAVELEILPNNPLQRMPLRRKKAVDAVDPRVVINHDQAHDLLAEVKRRAPSLHAYFACMYYAALRPAEARNVRDRDLHLPASGWGKIVVHKSYQVAGPAWTDSGLAGEERELKHRAPGETRPVPASPQLVAALREHLADFGVGAEGRLFVTRTGRIGRPVAEPFVRPISSGSAGRAWGLAREAALTEVQAASPLAARPYDLRHACVSSWLAAGVAPTQVARWAGHSVAVLLRVYAHCVDGQEATALRQIDAALGAQPPTGPQIAHGRP